MAASFGKLYLWRGGGFLKEASPLALPSESFTSGASFGGRAAFGFLRKAGNVRLEEERRNSCGLQKPMGFFINI